MANPDFIPFKGRVKSYDRRNRAGVIEIQNGDTIPFTARGAVMVRIQNGGKKRGGTRPFLSQEIRLRKVMVHPGQRVVFTPGFLNGDSKATIKWAPYRVWLKMGGR